jgi:hypothetical protein
MMMTLTVGFIVRSEIMLVLHLLLSTEPVGQRIHNVWFSFYEFGPLSSQVFGYPWGMFEYMSDMLDWKLKLQNCSRRAIGFSSSTSLD